MAIKTYPLNDIDYQAEDAELFHCTRTSGVYASGHFPVSVTRTDNNITIGKGIGWLKNTEFSGKVFASKEETTLNAGVPDASLPRIDAVVVRFDANQNETYFTIKQGSTGSTPTPPEVERSEYIYELHLYHIRRRPGATAITPGDITDLRMDANYCGLMADSVTQVDMVAINAQVREFISDWENQIANVTDGKMIESTEYPGCYYRMNRGVKEWLNPPMMEDVEYPTTKRQDGKRVYTKLLKARSQAGSVSLPDIERIVTVSAVAERIWNNEKLFFQLPVDYLPKDTKEIQKMQIYYHENRIVFQSVVAKGMYDLYITVEYTKPGDEVAYTNVTADGDILDVETNGDVSAQGNNLNVGMFTTVSADGGAYIRRLTINGVAYDLAVGQAGRGAPGTAYPGVPGQFYTDLDSGEVYVCMGGSSDSGVYIWRTIIPSRLPVSTIQINHKTGIGSATITATQGAIIVENGGDNAILHGIANPVNENDAANKQYVDSKIGPGSEEGVIPHIGADGNWYIGSTNTGVQATGPEGKAGNGIESIARTSGTGTAGSTDTYTITYTDGSTGTYTVVNGKDGYTPAKGVDYWTAADQESVVQQVIAALGTPVFGTVDEENNIILTGSLADGTYTLKYENADGVQVEIGTVDIGGIAYTNLIPTAEAIDSTDPYNGTGYKNGYYASSASPYEGEDSSCVLTGLIPYDGSYSVAELPSIYVKGATIDTSQSHVRFQLWKEDKTYINGISMTTGMTIETLADGYYKLTFASNIRDTYGAFGFVRMSLLGTGDSLIITVGEPIE